MVLKQLSTHPWARWWTQSESHESPKRSMPRRFSIPFERRAERCPASLIQIAAARGNQGRVVVQLNKPAGGEARQGGEREALVEAFLVSRWVRIVLITTGIFDAGNGTVKLASKSKVLLTNRHFPIQQAHVTCCQVSNDLFLNNR
jgi:hypothetical protein